MKGRNTSSAGPIPDCSANISSCNFRGIRPTLEHSDHKQQSSIWSTPCFYRQGKCQYFSQIDHAPRSHQRFLSAKPGACQQITIQICVISDINIICVSINYINGVGCHMKQGWRFKIPLTYDSRTNPITWIPVHKDLILYLVCATRMCCHSSWQQVCQSSWQRVHGAQINSHCHGKIKKNLGKINPYFVLT